MTFWAILKTSLFKKTIFSLFLGRAVGVGSFGHFYSTSGHTATVYWCLSLLPFACLRMLPSNSDICLEFFSNERPAAATVLAHFSKIKKIISNFIFGYCSLMYDECLCKFSNKNINF